MDCPLCIPINKIGNKPKRFSEDGGSQFKSDDQLISCFRQDFAQDARMVLSGSGVEEDVYC